jgi:hypothetical protein
MLINDLRLRLSELGRLDHLCRLETHNILLTLEQRRPEMSIYKRVNRIEFLASAGLLGAGVALWHADRESDCSTRPAVKVLS